MITKTIRTISGKVKLHIPENLSEITLGQMIAMEQVSDNSIPLIPELTEDIVNNIINLDDLLNIRERILSLAHQIKYCYNSNILPEKLMGVKVPNNLSIEPAGAYLVSRDLIADEINRHIEMYGEDDWKENFVPSLDTCAGILANYFYCRVTKELWSEQKANEFKEQVLKLSVQEALPVACFFFKAYPDLSKQKIGLWRAFKLILKRKQVSRRLRNSNG